MNAKKNKGDAAEREISRLISERTGFSVRRKLGAGRLDDEGDLDGIPDTTAQVASYKSVADAVRKKVPACVEQQERAGTTFGVTFLRLHGGGWVAVMTLDQWTTYAREAM